MQLLVVFVSLVMALETGLPSERINAESNDTGTVSHVIPSLDEKLSQPSDSEDTTSLLEMPTAPFQEGFEETLSNGPSISAIKQGIEDLDTSITSLAAEIETSNEEISKALDSAIRKIDHKISDIFLGQSNTREEILDLAANLTKIERSISEYNNMTNAKLNLLEKSQKSLIVDIETIKESSKRDLSLIKAALLYRFHIMAAVIFAIFIILVVLIW